ncbi:hypothetical protein PIB30_005605 [Stylosanthes scabra]|uniref:Transmembrane protein n=1 Tax=Stylosanthes scabra TaxID=79078 RepID=A0ABU6S406_9FABA|nr:hypothetical protein [Stylosanthes scabra]
MLSDFETCHDLLKERIVAFSTSDQPGRGSVRHVGPRSYSSACIVIAFTVIVIRSIITIVIIAIISTSSASTSGTSSVVISMSFLVVILAITKLWDFSLESGDQSEEFFSGGELLLGSHSYKNEQKQREKWEK